MSHCSEKIFTLYSIIRLCFEKNIPFFAYRLPNKNNLQVGIQIQKLPQNIHNFSEIDYSQGFYIGFFDITGSLKGYLYEPDITIDNNTKISEEIFLLLNAYKSFEATNTIYPKYFEVNYDEFVQQVKKIQEYEHIGFLKKAVLSRISIEQPITDYNYFKIYENLCKLYPEAFIYIFLHPYHGCWVGATPESFLIQTEEKVYTESIAGTQWLNGSLLENVVWTSKEIEEQAIVTEFIIENAKQMGIMHYYIEGPMTVKAGKLAHLKTTISFDKYYALNKIGQFIKTFHPTPAVCGSPQKTSLQLLKQIEKHSREFYTGLVGPINYKQTTALYTNIRCMQVIHNTILIYTGAGITKSSVPEKEWEETEQKKSTILSALTQ